MCSGFTGASMIADENVMIAQRLHNSLETGKLVDHDPQPTFHTSVFLYRVQAQRSEVSVKVRPRPVAEKESQKGMSTEPNRDEVLFS